MTTSSATKTPSLGAYNAASSWRSGFTASGAKRQRVGTAHIEAEEFGERDTVDHKYDDAMKGGTVTLVEAAAGRVHVRWKTGTVLYYHPGALRITKKAKEPSKRKKR